MAVALTVVEGYRFVPVETLESQRTWPQDSPEALRREAMGAFAHEIRTPLTSIKMVIELARRLGIGPAMTLDEEMASMLAASVEDLQRLADDLQEVSRLERGKLILLSGPCELAAAVAAARELVGPGITLDGPAPPMVEGPWDARHLVRAIAGFAQSANRLGEGSGSVAFESCVSGGTVTLLFSSGQRGGERKGIGADAGFSFFRSRQFVMAMGGSVDYERGERFVRFSVQLPYPAGQTSP